MDNRLAIEDNRLAIDNNRSTARIDNKIDIDDGSDTWAHTQVNAKPDIRKDAMAGNYINDSFHFRFGNWLNTDLIMSNTK